MSKEKAKVEVLKKEIKDFVKKDQAGIEIIWRDGDAPIIIPEIKDIDVNLSGTISSPTEYYKKRKDQFEHDRANVIFSKNPEKLSITLLTNEHKEKPRYKVTGTLEQSEELKMFGIVCKSTQAPKVYTVADLSKLLRFNKRLFVTVDEANKVLEGLMKFRAKIETTVNQIDTERGNKSGSYDIKVDSSIPMAFKLKLPLYKGKPAKEFQVDICFEVKSVKEISLWLESAELATFIQDDANKYIDEELSQMSDIVQFEQ